MCSLGVSPCRKSGAGQVFPFRDGQDAGRPGPAAGGRQKRSREDHPGAATPAEDGALPGSTLRSRQGLMCFNQFCGILQQKSRASSGGAAIYANTSIAKLNPPLGRESCREQCVGDTKRQSPPCADPNTRPWLRRTRQTRRVQLCGLRKRSCECLAAFRARCQPENGSETGRWWAARCRGPAEDLPMSPASALSSLQKHSFFWRVSAAHFRNDLVRG